MILLASKTVLRQLNFQGTLTLVKETYTLIFHCNLFSLAQKLNSSDLEYVLLALGMKKSHFFGVWAIVSRRSKLQDCSKHQTKSVQSCDGLSDIQAATNEAVQTIFCLVVSSKGDRPQSVPTGQLRSALCSSVSELWHVQKAFEVSEVIKQQPNAIKVTAYKNGKRKIFAKLFYITEALEPKDIPHDADVYISTEELLLGHRLEQVADVPCLLRKERVGELGHEVTYCVSIKRVSITGKSHCC
uniref:Uncharacterized protein n=1 Tax=Coturnix japonica TaxID=93934 RepID=A0A8C2YDN3_COTJA